MLNISTKLSGNFQADLAKFERKIQTQVLRSGAATMARVVQEIAKQHVPVDTGLLRDSIYRAYSEDRSNETKQTYHVSWNRSKAPHGQFIEWGTSKMSPRPFLRPAFDRIGEAIKAGQARMAERLKEIGGSN